MKVLSKILGAVLLLGCLAYISFVFGKYVLSSTLLKSIPKSERIISTDNPTPSTAQPAASPSSDQGYSPQVQMRVLPADSRADNTTKSNNSVDTPNDPSAADNTNDTIKNPKNFDESLSSSSHRRHYRTRRRSEPKKPDTPTKVEADSNKGSATPPKEKLPSANPPPIRRLNKVGKSADTSPVPKPEKSTSTSSSSSGDSGSISPVPKAE